MKIYKYIDVEQQDYISDKVYKYVKTHTNIFQRGHTWNTTHAGLLLSGVPELATELKKIINHDITMISIICLAPGKIGGTHIDTDEYNYRVLWPIKHCKGSYTKFFDLNGNKVIEGYGLGGDRYLGVEEVNPLIEIDSLELIKPAIFNTKVPHAVYTNPTCDKPRISMTIGFGDFPLQELFEPETVFSH